MASKEHLQVVADLEGNAAEGLREIGKEAKEMARKADAAFEDVEREATEMRREVEKDARKMGKSVSGSLKLISTAAIAAAGAVVARLGGSFVAAASRAQETRSKFNVVFGDLAGVAENTAVTIADAFGRSDTEIRNSLASFQDLFVPIGFANEAAGGMSETMTKLAIDLASFNNQADSEALAALQSALVGSHETVKKYGVVINEARFKQELLEQGIDKTVSELTEQEKVQLRMRILLEDTTAAQGDAIRTADSFANQLKRGRSEILGMAEEMGSELIVKIEETVAELGGMDRILELVRVGMGVLTEAFAFGVEIGGEFIGFLADLVEDAGGAEAVLGRVSRGFDFLAGTVKLVTIPMRLFGSLSVFVFSNLHSLAAAAWEGIKALASAIGVGLIGGFQIAVRAIKPLAEGLDFLTSIILDGLVAAVQLALEGIQNLLSGAANVLEKVGFDELAGKLRSAADSVSSFSEGLEPPDFTVFDSIVEGLESVDEQAEGFQEKLRTSAFTAKEAMLQEFRDLAPEFLEDVVQPAGEMVASMADSFGSAFLGTADAAEEAAEATKDAILSQTEAVAEGAEQMAAAAGDTAKSVAASTLGAVAAMFGASGGGGGGGGPAGGGGPDAGAGGGAGGAGGGAAGGEPTPGGAGGNGGLMGELQGLATNTAASFGDMGGAIVAGSDTAREAFRNFAQDFIRQATAIMVKAAALKAIGSLFGGPAGPTEQANGGVTADVTMANGGVVPFKAFASGGVVNEPTLALMGENPFFKGEAFVPLPDGKKIPVEGAGGATVNFNISANDSRSFDQQLFRSRETVVGLIREAYVRDRQFRAMTGAAR